MHQRALPTTVILPITPTTTAAGTVVSLLVHTGMLVTPASTRTRIYLIGMIDVDGIQLGSRKGVCG